MIKLVWPCFHLATRRIICDARGSFVCIHARRRTSIKYHTVYYRFSMSTPSDDFDNGAPAADFSFAGDRDRPPAASFSFAGDRNHPPAAAPAPAPVASFSFAGDRPPAAAPAPAASFSFEGDRDRSSARFSFGPAPVVSHPDGKADFGMIPVSGFPPREFSREDVREASNAAVDGVPGYVRVSDYCSGTPGRGFSFGYVSTGEFIERTRGVPFGFIRVADPDIPTVGDPTNGFSFGFQPLPPAVAEFARSIQGNR